MRFRTRGFSLIELMIALAIMGILVAVAMPSYQGYMRKGRRADAQQFMLTLAQANQRYFLDNRTFTNGVSTLVTGGAPTSVSTYYDVIITVTAGPPATFSISATPKASQTADSCGTLTITSANVKSSSSGSNCW